MAVVARRRYRSPTRRQHAQDTQRRILQAARALMHARGFQATTLRGIAELAEVAPQTIIATFGTKPRILAEIIRQHVFGERHARLIEEVIAAETSRQQLALLARINRQVYESGQPEFELLRGAAGAAPEVAELERELDAERRQGQRMTLDLLAQRGELGPGVDLDAAADLIWALSSYDLYRALVVECGWSPADYEAHVTRLIAVSALGSVANDWSP